jgi:hypothetical protein
MHQPGGHGFRGIRDLHADQLVTDFQKGLGEKGLAPGLSGSGQNRADHTSQQDANHDNIT